MMTEERLTQIKRWIDAFDICVVRNTDCQHCKYVNDGICPPTTEETHNYVNELIEEINDLSDYVDYLKRKLSRTGETYRDRV